METSIMQTKFIRDHNLKIVRDGNVDIDIWKISSNNAM